MSHRHINAQHPQRTRSISSLQKPHSIPSSPAPLFPCSPLSLLSSFLLPSFLIYTDFFFVWLAFFLKSFIFT